jgi:hypothetical protein
VVCTQEVNFTPAPPNKPFTYGSHPRPYLHMYARSNELEEKGVINLNAVNVENNPDMEMLLGVSRRFSIALLTLVC